MNWRKVDGTLVVLWILAIPISFLLKDSTPYVVFLSHYAIVISHHAAWRADAPTEEA